MVTMSEEIGKLATALVAAQADVETALKASTNPHYGSSYADLTSVLGVIKPALATHGLAMVQYPGYEDGIVTMTTILVHTTGQWLQSPLATSGVTYLRRTCASSLMALIADDDDGNAAVGPAPAKQTKPTKPTKKPTATESKKLLAARLSVLEAILEACEEHGGVDAKTLRASQEIIKDGGPLERCEAAIKHLEREVGR